jgi:hypothetical protein
MKFRTIWHGALLIVWALRGCHVYPNTGVKWLKNVQKCLDKAHVNIEFCAEPAIPLRQKGILKFLHCQVKLN